MAQTLNITSANSILYLGVTNLFPVAQQMQNFGDDDYFEVEPVETSERKMSVDALLSAGWIPSIKKMSITLMASSVSGFFFEQWYAAQQSSETVYTAFGRIEIPSIGTSYNLTNGFLANYVAIPPAKKVLMPRKFSIDWQEILGQPT